MNLEPKGENLEKTEGLCLPNVPSTRHTLQIYILIVDCVSVL